MHWLSRLFGRGGRGATCNEYLAISVELQQEGRWAEAINACEQGRIALPTSCLASLNLAICLLHLGRVDEIGEVLSPIEPHSISAFERSTLFMLLLQHKLASNDYQATKRYVLAIEALCADPIDLPGIPISISANGKLEDVTSNKKIAAQLDLARKSLALTSGEEACWTRLVERYVERARLMLS